MGPVPIFLFLSPNKRSEIPGNQGQNQPVRLLGFRIVKATQDRFEDVCAIYVVKIV